MALISPEDKRYPQDDPKRTGLFYGNKEIYVGKRPGRPPKRVSNPKNGWWSDDKKIEACTLYVATGDAGIVSELTGIPAGFIRAWKAEGWWQDVASQVVNEQDEKIVAKMHNTLQITLDSLVDRVQNGDHLYDKKSGEIVRIPVSTSDLNRVVNTLTDKRQLIQGKPTARTERVTAEQRLDKLAEKLLKFANATEIEHEDEEDLGGHPNDSETEGYSNEPLQGGEGNGVYEEEGQGQDWQGEEVLNEANQ